MVYRRLGGHHDRSRNDFDLDKHHNGFNLDRLWNRTIFKREKGTLQRA